MNSHSEDDLRSSIRELGKRPPRTSDLDLALNIRQTARRRWRNAGASAACFVALATIGVAAVTQAEKDAQNTPAAAEASAAASPACNSSPILDFASTRQVKASASAVTVCWWSNPSTGDPTQDAKSTLEAEQQLVGGEATELMNALRSADAKEPQCSIIDSPPPLVYEVLISTSAGVRSVSIPDEKCLGFALLDGPALSSDGVIKLIRALNFD